MLWTWLRSKRVALCTLEGLPACVLVNGSTSIFFIGPLTKIG